MAKLTCLTWNIHRCRGRDGIIDTHRTSNALIDLLTRNPADIVILTEADAEAPPYGAILDMERIEAATGLCHAHGDLERRWSAESHGFLGTIVLHAPHWQSTDAHLLDLPGHYPRGATIMTFQSGSLKFRLVATHLSLGQVLRTAQMRAVGQYLTRKARLPTVLAGDLNEWRPWGGFAFSKRVTGVDLTGPARRSFPAIKPVLPLDRVMTTAPAKVTAARVITSDILRSTSDHLPLWAEITLGA